MLSPVPGPMTVPRHVPAGAVGPSTAGVTPSVRPTRAQRARRVLARLGRPVARARGVATVGHELARELEGEPVVGEEHMAEAVEHGGLVFAEPRELRDRERRHRHAPRELRPGVGTELLDEPLRLRCRFGVVPELRRTKHPVVVVEHHHPVLLRGDAQGCRVGGVLLEERAQRAPPRTRVLLAARRTVVAGAAAPGATSAPVSASRTSALHADVDESTPTTSGTYFSALGSFAAGPLGHGSLLGGIPASRTLAI